MDTSLEFLKGELLKNGLRPSFHRLKVFNYLYLKKGHPTVDEIYNNLSEEIPTLSKATVYNTPNSFVNVGLARMISLDNIEARYDVMMNTHGHFQCISCGTITDFHIEIDAIPMQELVGYYIKEKNLYYRGLCPNCVNQTNSRKEQQEWLT